jgi:hypothetical protein
MSHRIEIEPISLGDRGYRYRATYAGDVLIESRRAVEFDACRALLAMGITGKLQVWRRGATFPAMTLDIEKAAGLTVVETETEGPRFTRWRPFSGDRVADAPPSRAGSPSAAILDPGAPLP